MSKSFEVTLESKVEVTFSHALHAKSYFLKGSEWSEIFYEYKNLNEVVKHIAFMFSLQYTSKFGPYFLEGYGETVKSEDGSYKINYCEDGDEYCINIKVVSELGPMWSEEV